MFAFRIDKAQWRYTTVEKYFFTVQIAVDGKVGNDFVALQSINSHQSVLCISREYSWDGPSGPTIDTPDFMRASLVHDALYQLMQEGYISKDYRKHADQIFFEILREDKMPWIRAAYSWLAVRLFGWISFI